MLENSISSPYFSRLFLIDNVEDAVIEDPNAAASSNASKSSSDPLEDAKNMTVDAEDLPEELPEGAITMKSLFMLGSGL